MIGYTKVFQDLLASSIWDEDDKTRIVWITMLIMCGENGVVPTSLSGLATLSRVSKEDCLKALDKLSAPDPDSRSTVKEGRRIEKVEGGWFIINHAKYRDRMSAESRREYFRLKKQEYRQRERMANKGRALRAVIRDRVDAEESVNGGGASNGNE